VLGNGNQWGINIVYKAQAAPKGIAEAFIYGKEFIGNNQVCLILGDNLFYGKLDFLRKALQSNTGGTIFGYQVHDPERYGVVELQSDGTVISIEEKPKHPKSRYAIPGLYVFNNDVISIAEHLEPGPRGELEITDVQKQYLNQGNLRVELMGRGIAWLDTGTPESLLEASQFIHAVEKRQNLKIACLEEIALQMNYITADDYHQCIQKLPKSSYREYCERVAQELNPQFD
jgi:glucose-1-phosphate thymidylyltransferase